MEAPRCCHQKLVPQTARLMCLLRMRQCTQTLCTSTGARRDARRARARNAWFASESLLESGCLFGLIFFVFTPPYFSHNGLPWTSSSTPSAAFLETGRTSSARARAGDALVSAACVCRSVLATCRALCAGSSDENMCYCTLRDGDLKLLGFRHFCPTAQAAKHDPKLAAGAMMRSVRLKSWVHMDPPEFRGRASCRISECLPADVYAIGALIALLCGIDKLHMDDGTGSSTRRPAKSTPSSRGTSVSWSPKSGPPLALTRSAATSTECLRRHPSSSYPPPRAPATHR